MANIPGSNSLLSGPLAGLQAMGLAVDDWPTPIVGLAIGSSEDMRRIHDELRRAVIDRARQFPGQEKQVVEFYRKNPQAMNELRAPVYEDKVMNFALELTKQEEKKVTPAQLMQFAAEQEREQALLESGGEDHEHHHHHEGECGPECDHDHDHGHHHHHD